MRRTDHNIYGAPPKIHTKEAIRLDDAARARRAATTSGPLAGRAYDGYNIDKLRNPANAISDS